MAGGSRTSAKMAVVAALAAGATVQDTAARTGVSERTIYRWRKQPDFVSAVSAVGAELAERMAGRLTSSAEMAIEVLRHLMAGGDIPPSVRLGAARTTLEMAIRWREVTEMEQRIAALEQRLNEGDGL